jgi:hypothetical protein
MDEQLNTLYRRGIPWNRHGNEIRIKRMKKIRSVLLLFCNNENLIDEMKTLERLSDSSFESFSYTIQEYKHKLLHLPVEKIEQEIQKRKNLFLTLIKEIHSRFGNERFPATRDNVREVVYDPTLNPFANPTNKHYLRRKAIEELPHNEEDQFSKKTKNESLLKCQECRSDHFHIDIQTHKIFCAICSTIYD